VSKFPSGFSESTWSRTETQLITSRGTVLCMILAVKKDLSNLVL